MVRLRKGVQGFIMKDTIIIRTSSRIVEDTIIVATGG